MAVLVPEETQVSKHWGDLGRHPSFPACHLSRPSICMVGPRGEAGDLIYGRGQTPVGRAPQKLATSSILAEPIRHGSGSQPLDWPINKLLHGCPEAFWWLTALTYSGIHRLSSRMGLAGAQRNHTISDLTVSRQKGCSSRESCEGGLSEAATYLPSPTLSLDWQPCNSAAQWLVSNHKTFSPSVPSIEVDRTCKCRHACKT